MEYDGQVVASSDPILVALLDAGIRGLDEFLASCEESGVCIDEAFVINGMPY